MSPASYFDDLRFTGADHVPDCHYQLEYSHPELCVLNFVAEGAIHFAAPGEESRVLEGPVAFWTLPGETYPYGNVKGRPWNQFWVSASGPRVDRMRAGGLIPEPPHCHQSFSSAGVFERSMSELVELVLDEESSAHPRAVQLFESLFLLISREAERLRGRRSPHERRLRELTREIGEAPLKDWDFHREASRLGLSYGHFRKLFRSLLGIAPGDAVLDARVRYAARLLRRTDRKIADISEECLCETPQYFSRLFKSRMGVSPKSYRDSVPLVPPL